MFHDLLLCSYLFSDDRMKSDEYGMIGISSTSSKEASLVASSSVSVFLAQALNVVSLNFFISY